MSNTAKRTRRVIHVPLTDREWKALHDRAFANASTKGEVTAAAIRAAFKVEGSPKAFKGEEPK